MADIDINAKEGRKESIWLALLPVVVMIGLLCYCVTIFGDGMLQGPSQIVLILSTGLAGALAINVLGHKWQDLEEAMVAAISRTMPAILILLMVGGICGTWMHSGIIPTMIYYGLEVISARWILLTSCVLCALVSLCIGSSWTTIATIGVGLMGVARTLGVNEAWEAGAIISGAYFGDKMSPMSETTNLASSISDVKLFDHIRNMLYTTVPTLTVTLIVFLCMGILGKDGADGLLGNGEESRALVMQEHLKGTFLITPWLLIVPLISFYLIYKGKSATMVLFLGMVAGGVIVCIRQGFAFSLRCAFGNAGYSTGYAPVDSLSNTGGIGGMLFTVWLIICSMSFGGVMERSGMLGCITLHLLKIMRGRVTSVFTTCLSCIFINVTTADQYLSIVLPSKMYGGVFRRQHLPNKLLSRTLEDGGTVTSVLIPWNSCGMTQSTVLGVSTLAYLPYTVFCWLSPIMTVVVAIITEFHKNGTESQPQ